MAVVSLLTDFGLADTYVGIMKGVMLNIAPELQLVDLSHAVPPQNILIGAYRLETAWGYFPPGSVHLCVVDPGVGGNRRAIIAKRDAHFFVAPDNGLLEPILAEGDCLVIHANNPQFYRSKVSATFHGRDIFAPLAAHLAAGVEFSRFGPEVKDPVRLAGAKTRVEAGKLWGRVLDIDRFGNVITSIPRSRVENWMPEGADCLIQLSNQKIRGLSRTYSDVATGQFMALIGSSGYLEVSIREGHAALKLGCVLGEAVSLGIADLHGA